jgi:aspartyl-tRNA(Asn)/glutamyl-tRNA(Gln) amidotransferase subunit A
MLIPYTVATLSEAIASGKLSREGLTGWTLERIRNPEGQKTAAFTKLYEHEAIATARSLDAPPLPGAGATRLAGLPVSIKDLFDVKGEVTLAASTVLKDQAAATENAPVVEHLRMAHAIIVGRANMTEFAYSPLGINANYGSPVNPADAARSSGGSSSGAGVAVANKLSVVSIGTDTAGSIRIPASFVGVVGFKPTQRWVSRQGAIPLSPSLDSIGPLAASVECCAIAHAVISGLPAPAWRPREPRGLRLGIPKQPLPMSDLDPEVAQAFDTAVQVLSRAGITIVEVDFPALQQAMTWYLQPNIVPAEAYRWHAPFIEKHRALYDPYVLGRIMVGEKMSDEDVRRLRMERASMIASDAATDLGVDAVILPTTPIVAPLLRDAVGDAYMAMVRKSGRNTAFVNVLDRCAISLPCHAASHLPVGFQLVGGRGEDDALLSLAATVEQVFREEIADHRPLIDLAEIM